jgi:hypothetical protein
MKASACVYNFIDPLPSLGVCSVCFYIKKLCLNGEQFSLRIYLYMEGGSGRNIRHDPQGTKGGGRTEVSICLK